MKTRNKVFIGTAVVLAVMTIAGYGLVSANGPWRGPCAGFQPGSHGRFFHTCFNNGDITDFILWRMDKKAEDLKLSGTQKGKYDEIKENLKSHFSEGVGDHRKFVENFHAEMSKEDPDIRLLIDSLKRKVTEISGFAEVNLSLLAEFYDTLDNNQQKMIIDEIKGRMEYRHSRSQ